MLKHFKAEIAHSERAADSFSDWEHVLLAHHSATWTAISSRSESLQLTYANLNRAILELKAVLKSLSSQKSGTVKVRVQKRRPARELNLKVRQQLENILDELHDPLEQERVASVPVEIQKFIQAALKSNSGSPAWLRFHGLFNWVSHEDPVDATTVISFRSNSSPQHRREIRIKLSQMLSEYLRQLGGGAALRVENTQISVVRSK